MGFAGYGRLGHAETKDEMIPRQVKVNLSCWRLVNWNFVNLSFVLFKQLENFRCVVTKITAGSSFCLASATNKNLYFWGQTKSSGEVKHMSVNKHIWISLLWYFIDFRPQCTRNQCRTFVDGISETWLVQIKGRNSIDESFVSESIELLYI